eukprot:CAMPEP_0194270780 /NCGR_PEP_ID=MMETSP0169-20130528/4697_1 /TAXON_ID=218684 /ORGANISM="Corethron pennatum, Strain L29A3" /LENGTH=208 /DNA_ID=CAMNT_0039012943 /DNA_START=252 /DNA_END=875 /DNA_ORIENTATION=+
MYDSPNELEFLGTAPDSLEKSVWEIQSDLCEDDTSFSGTIGGSENVTCDWVQRKTPQERKDFCVKFPDGRNQELYRFCPTSCEYDCLQTKPSSLDPESQSLILRSLQEICGDDNDFTFDYTDNKSPDQKATKCSDISELTPKGVITRVCRTRHRYPRTKIELSSICSRSCGGCPATEAPTQTSTVYVCGDDNDFTFDYTDNKSPDQKA